MRQPTIHRNGTGAQDLIEPARAVLAQTRELLETLRGVLPNARDYYPQGPQAFEDARDDFQKVVGTVQAVQEEVRLYLRDLRAGGHRGQES